jgi:transposase
MECPKCKNSQYIKSGKQGEYQRYKCKSCAYRYTVAKRKTEKPEEVRRMALELYLEGLGFRAIGRVLKISYGTVYKWIKKWGEKASLPVKQQEEVKKLELDEIHTYIGSKKTTVGYG